MNRAIILGVSEDEKNNLRKRNFHITPFFGGDGWASNGLDLFNDPSEDFQKAAYLEIGEEKQCWTATGYYFKVKRLL